jgi:hypothetical protein
MRRIGPLAAAFLSAAGAWAQPAPGQAERWGVYEISLRGPQTGNPYLDVQLKAVFQHQHRAVTVDGFYDGDGLYRVRFMPDADGEWTWTSSSNRAELNNRSGRFTVTPPAPGNHGPVTVRHTYHFGYADGTPYYPIGTTAYAWAHQGDQLEARTLATLAGAPFNKIRMCVFPKDYVYNKNEPRYYPFPRDAAGTNDYSRFNPEFFRHFEDLVRRLMELGLQADLILFHPYDRWGYQRMPAEADDRYLRYTVARLAAFRNVWWSLANEWDFLKAKKLSDWDRFFRIVEESDPYHHLRSIHNGAVLYDHARPWVTHASIQSDEFARTAEWLAAYRKPVIFDECKYEGDIPRRWGDISAQEMVRRFWLGFAQGAYVGHGETYLDPQDILWWSKGGVLKGQSPPRIAFLRRIVDEWPEEGVVPFPNQKFPAACRDGEYYLFYLDLHQPREFEFELPRGVKFRADIIDPWEMTITPAPGVYEGRFTLKLPGKPHQAVRFTLPAAAPR